MPAFGMSNAGKEAEGFPREYGAWSKEQMEQFLAQQGIFGEDAARLTKQAEDYWQTQMTKGTDTPEDIRSMGQRISPWVDKYADDSQTRLNDIWNMETGRKSAEEVAATKRAQYQDMKTRNEGNSLDLQTEIGDTAQREMGRNDDSYKDIVSNIKDTAGTLRSTINADYGGLRADNAKTWEGVKDRGTESFAEMAKNLELIAPGGQAAAARSGRAFAGQVSDVNTRLRRMGIDPNSPEAAAALRSVETARSRKMDDDLADSTLSYVDKSNTLGKDKLGFMTDADRARLSAEIDLGSRQSDKIQATQADEGAQFRTARGNLATQQNTVDDTRSTRRLGVVDKTFERDQDLSQKGVDLTDWERTADMQDRDRRGDVLREFNTNDVVIGGMKDAQFNTGDAYLQQDRQTKDAAAVQVGNMGRDAQNNFYRSNTAAQGWGNTAMGAYDKAYGYELPNANWGGKIIAGVGGAALNAVAPGLGTAVTGAVSPMLNGAPATGGGYGTGQQPGNPTVFSNQPGQQPGQVAGNQNFMKTIFDYFSRNKKSTPYDPSKTQTLPNGDLQVGTY